MEIHSGLGTEITLNSHMSRLMTDPTEWSNVIWKGIDQPFFRIDSGMISLKRPYDRDIGFETSYYPMNISYHPPEPFIMPTPVPTNEHWPY